MILLETIKNKLEKHIGYKELYQSFDCRYMQKWINLYPDCFPKYVKNGKYYIEFNGSNLRYEIHKIIY